MGGGGAHSLIALTPDPDLPDQVHPTTGPLAFGSHPGAMSHAPRCSLTLAGEIKASRETRTFKNKKSDFRFPVLAANKPAVEVTKCFLSKETKVSGKNHADNTYLI